MDLLEYISTYKQCAVNAIPKDDVAAIEAEYGECIDGLSEQIGRTNMQNRSHLSLRFYHQKCVGWSVGKYQLVLWPELEMVAQWTPKFLMREQNESPIDMGDLL